MNIVIYDAIGKACYGKYKIYNVNGRINKKDNSLCFRKNGKNVYIPVENTKEIFCFNEVSINTKLLDFLSQNNIIVHFFNYYGGYSGTYYPRDHYLSGKLLVKQVGKYNDDRMSIARPIVRVLDLIFMSFFIIIISTIKKMLRKQ